jgi:hypothetical protein
MDALKLAAGDNSKSPRLIEKTEESDDNTPIKICQEEYTEVTPEVIENNETKLKERITECRGIIESLKLELSKEKSKIKKEAKIVQQPAVSSSAPMQRDIMESDFILNDFYSSNLYSACIDSKLNCDENVIEYEKQLQKYQNTLNMAQMEKKNAIRKQMLAKAFRLKLLEVEHQCNIELLRVKQSLQCLEPLQMIANKWKSGSSIDPAYDLNNFELMPRFPELSGTSGSDINSIRDDFEAKKPLDESNICVEEEPSLDY